MRRSAIVLAIGLLAATAATPAWAGTIVTANWSMDSTTAMADSSGHGNNGTPTNVTAVRGVVGNGYHFNGWTSIALVPSSTGLNPGLANFRFSAYARLAEVPGGSDYDPMRKGLTTSPGGDYKLEFFPNRARTLAKAKCTFRGSAGQAVLMAGPNVADHAWHAVSCARTRRAIVLTVDGVPYSKPATIGSIANTAPLAIGGKYLGGAPGNTINHFYGDLDEARVEVG